MQRRSISCRNVENGNMVSEDTCQRLFHRDKPPVAQACTAGPCTASWVISPWSEVSKRNRLKRALGCICDTAVIDRSQLVKALLLVSILGITVEFWLEKSCFLYFILVF